MTRIFCFLTFIFIRETRNERLVAFGYLVSNERDVQMCVQLWREDGMCVSDILCMCT